MVFHKIDESQPVTHSLSQNVSLMPKLQPQRLSRLTRISMTKTTSFQTSELIMISLPLNQTLLMLRRLLNTPGISQLLLHLLHQLPPQLLSLNVMEMPQPKLMAHNPQHHKVMETIREAMNKKQF